MKRRQDHRERVEPGRDRKSRQRDFSDDGLAGSGQPLGIRGAKVRHQADRGERLERHASDAEAADLDQPFERFGGANQKPAMRGLHMHAVVANEPCEGEGACPRCVDQRQGEPRFPRARWPADQDRARADEDGRGVDGGHCGAPLMMQFAEAADAVCSLPP